MVGAARFFRITSILNYSLWSNHILKLAGVQRQGACSDTPVTVLSAARARKSPTEITAGPRLFYRVFGAGAVVVGAAGVTVGVMTRGALEVWPVVVPGVEVLAAGDELLIAVRLLLPQGPNSISAPATTTATIIAVIVPVPIPVLRLSRPVRLSGVRLLNPGRLSRPV